MPLNVNPLRVLPLIRPRSLLLIRYNRSFNRCYSTPSDQKESSEQIQFPKYNEKTYGADVKKFSQLPVNFGANQHISIDDTLKEKLRSVLWQFNAPIRYAFAYGSGVFQQAGADPETVLKMQEDLI
jgi:Phosphatidate cytidylyltransferase, mitochondrial